mmetsp:Transcript_55687/g.141639  ORF Transcript_55687/g.141639 Transcript_55687/m.141639 type:complete len:146 (-) Transcript_55687:231-668(-)
MDHPGFFGGSGTCVRKEGDGAGEQPGQPVVVGEGETCTRGLPPQFSKHCGDGLVCHAEHHTMRGGIGTCVRREHSEQPTPVFVGEGEACTRGVGPAHARLCKEGFVCHAEGLHMIGGVGICVSREAGEHGWPGLGNQTNTSIFFP